MSIENKIKGKSLFLSLIKENKPSKILIKKYLIFLTLNIKIIKMAETIINVTIITQKLLFIKYK